jgi:hypothetical protein
MVQLTELTDEEQRELEETTKQQQPIITTTDRIRIFRRPYVHILTNSQVCFL